MIGLVIFIGAIAAVLSLLPNDEPYRCKACGFETLDREQAAGHQALHSLHRVDL